MKLVTSLCFAISLFLAVNQRSSAQTQNQQGQSQAQQTAPDDKSQAQNQAGQNSALQQAIQGWTSTGTSVSRDGLIWSPDITWMGTSYQGSGMSLAPAGDVLRDHLMLPKGQGLVVTALDGNSPEARAGIQLNDVLLKLGDIPLGKPEDLDESVKKMGENPVLLFLFRGGRQLKFMVQPQVRVTLGPAPPKPAEHEYWIGVSVSAIEPVLRSQLQIPANAGLIVDEVVNDSPAAKAGVKVHDIVLDLDGKPLSDPGKLAEFVQANGEKPIVARLLRAGGMKDGTVELTPGRRKSKAVAMQSNVVNLSYYIRPGALWMEPFQAQEKAVVDVVYTRLADSASNLAVALPGATNQKPAEDANTAVAKRLDALDAEIKQLRKAVEGIGKAEKIIEELNRAIEALNKAPKEKK